MIYIAGKIRNAPNYHAKFAQAADQLRAQGFKVFNPAAANLESDPLPKIMSYVLARVCESDAIAMLPGWYWSGGARIEWLLAKYLGIKVIYL